MLSEFRKKGSRSNLIRIFNEINCAALFYNMGNKEKISFGKEALGCDDWMLLGWPQGGSMNMYRGEAGELLFPEVQIGGSYIDQRLS